MVEKLSLKTARRMAIHAQGLSVPRPAKPGRGHVRKLARDLGAVQIDSVNVVARAHYLPLQARLGAYDTAHLDKEAWGKAPSLFEYWAHALCLMPVEMQPLFRWRMQDYRRPEYWMNPDGELKGSIQRVLDHLRDQGAVTGGHFAEGKRTPGWWNWNAGKRALEYLFRVGDVSLATRRGFERVYDLTERVIPSEILNVPTPSEDEAIDSLIAIAARAMGVATVNHLRDYFRTSVTQTKASVGRLVEAGALIPVRVEGWAAPAYMHPDAKAPRRGAAGAILSPFDNMIWHRERAEDLFGLKFKIQIYTPAEQRVDGYYVLMFLKDDGVAARIDLKSDRKAGVLRVQQANLQPGRGAEETAAALADELKSMSLWLGLGGVAVTKKGDLSAALERIFD